MSDLPTGSLVPREGSGTINDRKQYSWLQELCCSLQYLPPFHRSIVVIWDSRSEGRHRKWGKHNRAWNTWAPHTDSTCFVTARIANFPHQIETQNTDKTRKVSACRGPVSVIFRWSLLSWALSDRLSHTRPSCHKPKDLVLAEFTLSVNSFCPIVLCLADRSHSAHLWTTGYKFY